MTAFDIIVAIPLVWGIVRGFMKGVVIEISSILSLILGVYLAGKFSDKGAEFLLEKFNFTTPYLSLISFIIIVLIVIILVFLIAKLLERVVEVTGLDIVNKILGSAFGCVKFAVLVSLVLLVINTIFIDKSFFSEDTKKNSYLYEPVSAIAPLVIPGVKDKVQEMQASLVKPSSVAANP